MTPNYSKVILFLSSLGFWTSCVSSAGIGISELIGNTVKDYKLDHEISVIADWSDPEQADLTTLLASDEIPAQITELSGLENAYESSRVDCPIVFPFKNMTENDKLRVVAENDIAKRMQLIPSRRFPRMILVWVKQTILPKVLKVLEKSIMWCDQKIDMGIFDFDTKFIFVKSNHQANNYSYPSEIFNIQAFKDHPHVTIADDRLETEGLVYLRRNNHFYPTNGKPEILSQVWRPTSIQTSMPNKLFPEITSFEGKALKVIAVLFAHYIQGYFVPDGGVPNKRVTGHYGLTVDFTKTLAEKLGAAGVEYLHPEPMFDYGGVGDDGKWTGQVRMMWEREADMTCDLAFQYGFRQILRGPRFSFPEYLSFASPKNVPTSKTFSLLTPFDLVIWTLLTASVLIFPFVLYVLGSKYHHLMDMTPLELINDQLWYCFGIMMGEDKVTDIKVVPVTQRSLLGSWLLFCMIMGMAYSSILKSHLMTPETEPSIDSLKGIVESGLRIKMAVYDDVFDNQLVNSGDPVRAKLWELHEPLTEFRGPLTDVEKGDAVNINWRSHLNAMIKIHHSTSDGQPFVHLADPAILVKTFLALNFTPDKPWAKLVNRFANDVHSSGLISHWESDSFRRMRVEQREQDRKDENPFESRCDGVCPLELEHYAGAFVVFAASVAVSVIGMAAELVFYRIKTVKRDVVY